jgi:hypothetical protein
LVFVGALEQTSKLAEFAKLSKPYELFGWVTEDRRRPAGITIDVDEASALDAVLPLPLDRERRVGVLDLDRFGIALAGDQHGQVIARIEQPSIAGFGREQPQLLYDPEIMNLIRSGT